MNNSYFKKVKPTYIENWPDGLASHSVPSVYLALKPEEVDALIVHNFMRLEDSIIPLPRQKAVLRQLETKIDSLVKYYPSGAFVRLGSRSPKDSHFAYKNKFKYLNGQDTIKTLCDSERVYYDLQMARYNNYTPYIVVRKWMPIEPWREFRCFIRNRRLVGISQYYKNKTYPEIQKQAKIIEQALRRKTDIVAFLLPAEDVIIDYIYKKPYKANKKIVNETILLEVNPFLPYTDPCLFNWGKDRFEQFEFRFLEGSMDSVYRNLAIWRL